MKKISIIGAGGHTRSVIPQIKRAYKKCQIIINDNSYNESSEEKILGIKITGEINDIENDSLVFLSIGDNKLRSKLFFEFSEQVIQENLIFNNVIIEDNVLLGIANQILSNVFINSCVRIGDNNIINTGALLEHEVSIGDHNHISVGARVCGRVTIGDHCLIGAGATIIDNISITDNVIVGAGSCVVRDIQESGTYVGVPVRKIK